MGLAPDLAARRAEISPEALAFLDHETGESWSFARVDHAARRMAAALLARVRPGARVAILCHNRPEFFVALFACQKAGTILVPLNWRQPVPELREVIDGVGGALILHDDPHADIAAALGLPCLPLDAGADGPVPARPIDEDAPWYVLMTSGTTGVPKAVIQTPRMAQAVAMNLAQALGLTAADRTVNYLPLFHTAGINLLTLPLFQWGGCSRVLRRFDARVLLDLLERREVTQFFGVPAIFQALAPLLPADMRLDAVRGWACGGAALPERLIRAFADRGAIIRNGFGMTETGPTGFLIDEAGAIARIGSVGKPLTMTEARLAGVADGQPGRGEILMRGATVTPGYLDNPRATAEAFTPDGWLRTGDIAERDADGYYRIVDRIKDMFISGGENVYPAEVERHLAAHPDIAEAAIVGVPDETWGEVGKAFVIAHPGTSPDGAALAAWLRERLAAYKIPRHWVLVQDLPRTASGKVRKAALKGGPR
ncbi:MAG: long-chain fatty acid--CoA ligase [Pararhodobacter sp.]